MILGLLLLFPGWAWAQPDALMTALTRELARSFDGLSHAEKTPLHYLGYEVWDERHIALSAVVGAMDAESDRHARFLRVDARVGSARLDNTHQVKGPEAWRYGQGEREAELPLDDDEAALRASLWTNTDQAFKDALNQFTKMETNKAVTATEEDDSADFSKETPLVRTDPILFPAVDNKALRERLKRLSLALKPYPFIFESQVWASVYAVNRYQVNSEGSSVVVGERYVHLGYSLSSRTSDGMDLSRSKGYDVDRPEEFPSDEEILRDMKASAAELEALRNAPPSVPYTGPAIIRNRATGVYFHEILGHRLEGHRQRLEGQGQTFTKMLGQSVVSPLISVYDDPTLRRYKGRVLRGAYAVDDEGVPAQRVALIEQGVLKNFLMSRMPVKGFARSNGHGRRQSGHQVVPRMGNTIVEASRAVPYATLREMLLDEVRRQGKPYGLIFDDIVGGFTMTTRDRPQSFKVIPLLVYRVFADGRPDEPVRGVDIVGTPLNAFTKILAAADDMDIFNGTCGAESGGVPVSAVAPSLLVSEIEVEKKDKSSVQPPVLPIPFHDPEDSR